VRNFAAQNLDPREFHANGIVEVPGDPQRALCVLECHIRRLLLHQTLSIIDIELALSLSVLARSNQQLEIALPDLPGGHRSLGLTEREDRTTFDVQWDLVEGDVLEGVLAERYVLAADVVVPDVIGEVYIDARAVLLSHGSDQDRRAKEELKIHPVSLHVLRVFEPQRVNRRSAVEGLAPHGGVQVVEQLVPDADSFAGGRSDDGPEVRFLRDSRDVVVIAVEWVKSSESGPAGAERVRSVPPEPAYVGAN
jgi:hypothetical protein